MITLIQIENNEPTYLEIGSTINELKAKLDIDGKDTEGFISAINKAELPQVKSKHEIRKGVWLIFT